MSSPTFRECPPSETPHFQNRDGWPVPPLGAQHLSEFAPRRPAPDRRRFHRRDRSRVFLFAKGLFAKSPTASFLLPQGSSPKAAPSRWTHDPRDRSHQKLPLRLFGH